MCERSHFVVALHSFVASLARLGVHWAATIQNTVRSFVGPSFLLATTWGFTALRSFCHPEISALTFRLMPQRLT